MISGIDHHLQGGQVPWQGWERRRAQDLLGMALVPAMARDRKTARMQEQIKVLLSQGLSIRKVALALGISRQTVRKFGMDQPEEASIAGAATGEPAWDAAIDWQDVAKQVAGGATMRLEHKPGEQVQIDYCDGIDIVDRVTGECRKTHLFCAVLPFSSYTFGEFAWSQNLASFIESHERMWAFFGGVVPYVVIDNLKSGVRAAHRYDPDVNPTYCEYGNHQGFAVLPARPYKPRDKATVEATIGAIQRGFFQEVRKRLFYSLPELNSAFRAYLERFNDGVMKDHGSSRRERFAQEKPLLRALPKSRFELFDWRTAKVHPDCHVQVDKNFYSAPHRMIGQTVRVRVSAKLVELFTADHERLAAHARLSGTGKFSTEEQHYPDGKLSVRRFEIRSAQAEAERVGPKTLELVQSLIHSSHPLRYLRRVQGILRLQQGNRVTREALEYAADKALTFKKPRLNYIKACAEHYDANGARPVLVKPKRDGGDLYLHRQADRTDAGGGES